MRNTFAAVILALGPATAFASGAAEPFAAEPGSKFLGSTWRGHDGKQVSHANDPLFGTMLTQITPENAGKWRMLERDKGSYTWQNYDRMMDYAAGKGLTAKHHVFVWGLQQPDWSTEPRNLKNMKNECDRFIGDFFTRYGGRTNVLKYAEVVNEPISQPAAYRNALGGDGRTGWDWVVWTFERARFHADRTGSPAKLMLNEWGVERGGGKAVRYRAIAELLRDRQLADVIGLQAHFLEDAIAGDVRKGLDFMAETGLPLWITEFELNIADDDAHAAKFKELFTVFWEHPSVIGVTFWGHVQGGMWRKNGYLLRADGTERPALTWLREYVSK